MTNRPVEPVKTAEDKYHPRGLPSYREDDKNVFYREGVGLFHVQGVGSTARGYGVQITFHAEGERDSRSGHYAFQIQLTDDLKIEWKGRPGPYCKENTFSDSVVAVMQDIMDNYHLTNEMDFWWDINDELNEAIKTFDSKLADWNRSVETYTKFLIDKNNPRTKFDMTLPHPSGEQEHKHVRGQGLVLGPKMGAERPTTPEEHEKTRVWWSQQLQKAVDAVSANTPEPERIQRIRIARKVTTWWSRAQRATDGHGFGLMFKQKGSRVCGMLRVLVEQAFAGNLHMVDFEYQETYQKKRVPALVKPPVEGNTLFICYPGGGDYWCEDKGLYSDGSRRLWVINGCFLCEIHPDGRFGTVESQFYNTGAEILWEGKVPKKHGGGPDPDYEKAMNWIREMFIPAL